MNAVSRLFTLICLLGLCLVLGGQPAQAQRSESFAQTPTGAENFVEVNFDYFTDATRSVTWGDYDGDGDLDLAVGNGFWLSSGPSNNVTVYENVGGVLKFDPANGLGWQTYEYYVMSVAWGDYDGDGDLDLAVGKLLGDNKVYENVGGDQKFIQGWQSGNSGFTNCVAWGDYDGDGDLDLATGNGYYYGGNDKHIKVY